MQNELLYNASFYEEGGFRVDYYLTCDKDAHSESYGVGLVKTDQYTCSGEFSYARGISQDRKEAAKILQRLFAGRAMPSTLADIIDDYFACCSEIA